MLQPCEAQSELREQPQTEQPNPAETPAATTSAAAASCSRETDDLGKRWRCIEEEGKFMEAGYWVFLKFGLRAGADRAGLVHAQNTQAEDRSEDEESQDRAQARPARYGADRVCSG